MFSFRISQAIGIRLFFGKPLWLHGKWVESLFFSVFANTPAPESGTVTAIAMRDRQTSLGVLTWRWHRLDQVSELGRSANILPAFSQLNALLEAVLRYLSRSGQMCCCWGQSNCGNSVVGSGSVKIVHRLRQMLIKIIVWSGIVIEWAALEFSDL